MNHFECFFTKYNGILQNPYKVILCSINFGFWLSRSLAGWADGFKTRFGYAPAMRRTLKRYAPISGTENDIQTDPARHTKAT